MQPGSLRTGNEDGRGSETLARTVLIHGKFHRCLPLVLIALQNKSTFLTVCRARDGWVCREERSMPENTTYGGDLEQRPSKPQTFFFGLKTEAVCDSNAKV